MLGGLANIDRYDADAFDSACAFVEASLLPYLRALEFTLDPAAEGAFGSAGSQSHAIEQRLAIVRASSDLLKVRETLRDGVMPDPRRVVLPLLFGIHAMSRTYFECEEALVLPVLAGQLSESQDEVLARNTERIMTQLAPDDSARGQQENPEPA